MLVELKNGETLNGHLVNCDTYMNLTLKEVVQTSPDGDKFFRLPECYVRGNNVPGHAQAARTVRMLTILKDQIPAGTGRDCRPGQGPATTAAAFASRWSWRWTAKR